MLNRPPRRTHGFTLVELLVALAVLTILVSIGVPEMRTFVINGRIRATSESIIDGLQLARAEAVRRNSNVQFTLAGAGWTVTQVTSGETIQTKPAAEGSGQVTATANNGTTSVTFNTLGRVPNFNAAVNLSQIDVDVPTSVLPASATRDMRVVIFPGGQIRLCDPNVTTAGDPRRC